MKRNINTALLTRVYSDIRTTMMWYGSDNIAVNEAGHKYFVKSNGFGVRSATKAMDQEAENLRKACESMSL